MTERELRLQHLKDLNNRLREAIERGDYKSALDCATTVKLILASELTQRRE